MRIAVIGWGSLIWCPGCLQIQSRWHRDGPELPIEFARISGGDRVTLVILPHVGPQRTLWASSACSSLKDAIENLRIREGMSNEKRIHWASCEKAGEGIDPEVSNIVRRWLERHDTLEAAVWTGLPSNWCEKRKRDFTPADVVAYLKELTDDGRHDRAEEYIRNTPESIRTLVRERIERELRWTPNPLPAILFEDAG